MNAFLAALDLEGSERFIIVVLDATFTALTKSFGPMTEQEARRFFASNDEDEDGISKRIRSARDSKGKV